VNGEDRLPPSDSAAEQAALGCILLNWQESIPACIQAIGPNQEIFYDLKHREIYRIMVEMYDSQEAIDLVTLQSWLEFQGLLDQVGGIKYLSSLSEAAPSAANLEYYLGILLEKFKYRKLIQISTGMVANAYDGSGTADELITGAAEDIQSLVDDSIPKQEESCIHDLVLPAINQIEQWSATHGVVSGISTGFPDLDKMTTGFHPGDLIVIAATTSMGKTSLAMNFAEHAAVEQGLPVGVFSLEMTKESLTIRMLCSRARVNLKNIRDGFMVERDLPKLAAASGKLHSAKIFINDQSGLSILELRTRARRMWQKHGIKLLVVDYIQLMHADRNRNDSREREVATVSSGLKSIGKELQIPVVAISQLNRDIERDKSRRPRISDLRESGAIGNDADLVGILWKPSRDNDDDGYGDSISMNLEILKQRNGPTGTVPLTFLRQYTRFESAAKVTQEDQDQAKQHYQAEDALPEPSQEEFLAAPSEDL
jgi:replicative DNA helicase